MPGQRRSSPGAPARGSWLPKLAGLAAVLVLAGAATTAYLLAFHPGGPPRPAALPSKVLGYEVVGLVAESAGQGGGTEAGSPLVQLLTSAQGPIFVRVRTKQPSGRPQWTADQMADGTYIFIYLPTGQCLSSAGPRGRPRLAVLHCRLTSLGQRWQRLSPRVLRDGHDFYQFRSAASRQCLTQLPGSASQPGSGPPAGLAVCGAAHPASQLIAFWWS